MNSMHMSIPKATPADRHIRKDSWNWTHDDFLCDITHTPPAFSPGSLELPLMKRTRTGSISGRLRSASDLEERGLINRYQKGILKVSKLNTKITNCTK